MTKGYDYHTALELVQFTKEQYEEFRNLPVKLPANASEALGRFIDLQNLTYGMIERLPKNFWYKLNANCEERTQEIIKNAMNSVLKKEEFSKLEKLPDTKISKHVVVNNESKEVEYQEGDIVYDSEKCLLIFKDIENDGKNAFQVGIKQIKIENSIKGTPSYVLLIETSEGNKYIAYDGAIVPECHINSYAKKEFEQWGKLLGGIQSEVLSETASEFIIDLFDSTDIQTSSSENMTAEELEQYHENVFKNKSNEEIEKHYKNIFEKLKAENKLTAENVLRIMPNDCSLSINSCNTNDNILWGISTSWKDISGKTTWKLRIHSTDLQYPKPNGEWIVKFEYEDSSGTHCLEVNTDENSKEYFRFGTGNFKDASSHILVDSPVKDKLLNNVDFQNIIKEISIKKAGERYYKHNELKKLSIQEYAKNKKVVDQSRQVLGMFDLNEEFVLSN